MEDRNFWSASVLHMGTAKVALVWELECKKTWSKRTLMFLSFLSCTTSGTLLFLPVQQFSYLHRNCRMLPTLWKSCADQKRDRVHNWGQWLVQKHSFRVRQDYHWSHRSGNRYKAFFDHFNNDNVALRIKVILSLTENFNPWKYKNISMGKVPASKVWSHRTTHVTLCLPFLLIYLMLKSKYSVLFLF